MAKKVKKANALNSSNRSINNRAAPNYNLINKSNKLKKIAKKRQWNWKKSMNYRPFGFNQRNLFNNAYNNQNVAPNQQQSMPTTSNQPSTTNSEFRHIIIDGSNVAFTHGHGQTYSSRGIQLAVEFFIRRGHSEIKALVPRFRRSDPLTRNPEALDDLEQRGFLVYTPSRYLNGKLIAPYDDRFILDAALYYNAVIVSNDNYMDLKVEKPDWQILVDTSLLQFMFVGDLFMVAVDPMGRDGPSLDEFLKNQNHNQIQNPNQNQNQNQNQISNQNKNQDQNQNQNQNKKQMQKPNQNQNQNQNENINRPKKKQKVHQDENQYEEVPKHLDKEDLVAYRANRTPLLPNPPVIPRLMENQLIETPKKVDKNVPVVDLTQSPIKAPGLQDVTKKQQQTENQQTSSKRNVTLKTEIVPKPFNQIDNNNNNQQDRVVTMNN